MVKLHRKNWGQIKNATQALFYLFIYCCEVFVIELT